MDIRKLSRSLDSARSSGQDGQALLGRVKGLLNSWNDTGDEVSNQLVVGLKKVGNPLQPPEHGLK